MAKFFALDEDNNTKKNKNRPKKTKYREDNSKKRRKNSSLNCSLHGEKNSHTSRKCKVIKARDADKDKSKYGKKY